MNIEKTLSSQTGSSPAGVWPTIRKVLDRVGFTPAGFVLILVLAVLPLIPPFNQEHIMRWLVMGAFLGAQTIAFDFSAGYINVVNFGFAAILGLGTYTSAILANEMPILIVHPGISPWITIWIGALVAGLVGFLLGLLTLRLRGIFAAVMAWFLGIALMGLANNLPKLTRGSLGFSSRPLLDTSSNLPYFYVIFAMMLLTYLVLKQVTKSHYGLAFLAIGQNIDAAKASGINPTRYRIINFTLSCVFAGLLGGFYAHYIGSLTPKTVMHTSKTVEVLTLSYIGGRGSIWGGVAVAFPFVFFIEFLRSNFSDLPGLHLVIYGVLMIVVMIFYPGGFAQLYNTVVASIRGLFSKH